MGLVTRRGLQTLRVCLFLLTLLVASWPGSEAIAQTSAPTTIILGLAGNNPLFPTNTYEAHIRNLLLAGKLSEALSLAKEHYGKVPAFLQRYAAAFDTTNRSAGNCQKVAKSIHEGLAQLGTKAEYIALRSTWDNITIDLPNGTNRALSNNGYHILVKVESMAYDAYTGAAGMKFAEYLSRLHVHAGHAIQTSVASKP